MGRTLLALVVASASAAWLVASCSSEETAPAGGTTSSTSSVGGSGGGAGTGTGVGAAGFGGFDGGSGDDCSDEAKLVYLLTRDDELVAFDPAQAQFTDRGVLSCPGTDDIFDIAAAMTVDRQAVGWVLYNTMEGMKLFQFDLETLDCQLTSYQHDVTKPVYFLAFSSDGAQATTETLYATAPEGQWFGRIEQPSLTVTTLGELETWHGSRVMITGTGSGKLFAIYQTDSTGETATIAEIDKADGSAVGSNTFVADEFVHSGTSAFAFWGGDFWLFVSGGPAMSVLQYTPGDAAVTLVTERPATNVAGVGVSTCAPIEPPS